MIDETVGEPFATDSDALQHSVAPQLMHDKVSIDDSRAFQLVGNDAADKMGYGVPEGGHEVVQGLLVEL